MRGQVLEQLILVSQTSYSKSYLILIRSKGAVSSRDKPGDIQHTPYMLPHSLNSLTHSHTQSIGPPPSTDHCTRVKVLPFQDVRTSCECPRQCRPLHRAGPLPLQGQTSLTLTLTVTAAREGRGLGGVRLRHSGRGKVGTVEAECWLVKGGGGSGKQQGRVEVSVAYDWDGGMRPFSCSGRAGNRENGNGISACHGLRTRGRSHGDGKSLTGQDGLTYLRERG